MAARRLMRMGMNARRAIPPLLCMSVFAKVCSSKPLHTEAGSSLRVHIAASCFGLHPDSNSQWRRCDCGEDAFIAKHVHKSRSLLAVADGVGGWRNMGVDPSMFSWALMNNTERAYDEMPTITPTTALTTAYEMLVHEKKVTHGSSTACIVVIDSDVMKLNAANLGDSGFLLIRNKMVAAASTEQQLVFNAPYQLSIGGGDDAIRTLPNRADAYSADLLPGDLVIVGTDGFFDNVYRKDIVKVMTTVCEKENLDVNKMASWSSEEASKFIDTFVVELKDYALVCANSKTIMSPFYRNVLMHYPGTRPESRGKPDDITIVAAVVVQ